MKKLFALFIVVCPHLLTACVTHPAPVPEKAPELETSVKLYPDTPPEPPELDLNELQNRLGLERANQDLGFDERAFDGCLWNLRDSDSSCGQRYLSVINFRLVCRETTETAQDVSATLTPLSRGAIEWRLAGASGHTQTNGEGYGLVRAITSRPTKGQRFILILGGKSLGLEVGEVSQIVLPGNWCEGY